MSQRRITIITRQLLGYFRSGGVGTATTFLALALARMDHSVEILYAGSAPTGAIDPQWGAVFDRAGVRVRTLPHGQAAVEPQHFARMRDVELALRADPPDVVIVHDFSAPAYSAMQLHRLGLDFERTLFVVYCHGTWRLAKHGRRVRVSANAIAVNVLEQASIEIADVAVSPSAYLVDWMGSQGWRLPERTFVIPHLTRTSATGERPPESARRDGHVGVERIAFFGRLEETKGLRPFAAGLNGLGPELLGTVELEFLGKPTKGWSAENVEALLSETTRQSLRRISFATDLDQQDVIARLSRPGTLAVIPSLIENSPNSVYECLEHGIPFVASDVGGIRELVAPQDAERVLFEPTAQGVENALTRALANGNPLRPVQAAFDADSSPRRWAEVIEMTPPRPIRIEEPAPVDVVVVHRNASKALERCLSALARQRHADFRVIVAVAGNSAADVEPSDALPCRPLIVSAERSSVQAAREAGLQASEAPWIVFLDEEDVPEETFLETLVRAQTVSGADVVTCALTIEDDAGGRVEHFFFGEPRAVGVLENGYGTAALIRRSLVTQATMPATDAADPDWQLLAGLSLGGARIVSVPTPLLTRQARPGTLGRHPADALLVLERFERALPDPVASVARLAAGLAAEAQRQQAPAARSGSIVRRAGRRALRLSARLRPR